MAKGTHRHFLSTVHYVIHNDLKRGKRSGRVYLPVPRCIGQPGWHRAQSDTRECTPEGLSSSAREIYNLVLNTLYK